MGAIGLRVTDGTTTVTVSNGTTGWLIGYRQGAVGEDEPNSTDTAKVVLLSSLSTIQATVGSLNKMFRQARSYQKSGVGARVYVERDLGDSVWWRSEILDALPVTTEETFELGLATGKVEMSLVFTRVNYWEGAEAQIPLTNSHATDNTSGLIVESVYDNHFGIFVAKNNFVDIDGVNDMAGDLPAPIRLEYTNTYNDGDKVERVWTALNWKSSPATCTHTLEGEDAAGGSVARTVLPASPDYDLYSNGKYDSFSVGAAEAWVYWTLTAAHMLAAAGNYFRLMVMPTTIPTDTWFKVQILGSGGLGVFYESDYVLLDATYKYQELCVLRLPPIWPLGSQTLDTLRLQVVYKRPTGTTTMGIDYLELLPLDGYRMIDFIGYDMPYNYVLVDNQYAGSLYDYAVGSTAALAHHVPYGGQIRLEPGVVQRLYIVGYGDDLPLRTGTVKIWYRPRRLVL